MLHTAAALHVHFYVVFNHLKIGTLQDRTDNSRDLYGTSKLQGSLDNR